MDPLKDLSLTREFEWKELSLDFESISAVIYLIASEETRNGLILMYSKGKLIYLSLKAIS